MERYFTTVALLGVNDGNLPVHRYDNDSKSFDFFAAIHSFTNHLVLD